MKTMHTGPWARRAPRTALAVGALLAAALASGFSASAQDRPPRPERVDCRCVDREGNEIENCRCLRTDAFARTFPFGYGEARARLGVTVTTDQPSDEDARGARVASVLEDGPADEAGLQEGDVITHVQGRSLLEPLEPDVEEAFDLDRSIPVQRLLAVARELEPGEEVEVRYLRDGTAHTTTLEARALSGWGSFRWIGPEGQELSARMRDLGDRMRALHLGEPGRLRFEMPEGGGEFHFEGPEGGPGGVVRIYGSGGLELLDLNPELGEYFGATEGVLVTDVDEDSALGLRPGDVVLAVGDREVSDADHLRRILRSYEPDEPITLRVLRERREMSVQGRTGG